MTVHRKIYLIDDRGWAIGSAHYANPVYAAAYRPRLNTESLLC